MNLMVAGMGGLQSWIGNQASMHAMQPRNIQQRQPVVTGNTNSSINNNSRKPNYYKINFSGLYDLGLSSTSLGGGINVPPRRVGGAFDALKAAARDNITLQQRLIVPSPKLRVNTFPSRLDQVQSFPAKSISDNDLAISPTQQQQLKSNTSWMKSILSFSGDLLFWKMAYAEGPPQSSDDVSSFTEKQQPRARFKLRSQFPAHSNDPILEHVYAVGKGIEQARDAVTDLALHPVDNFKELSLMSWDGYNAMSGLLFGYSTTASRARNAERGAATLEAIDYIKQADSAKKLEIGSAIVAGSIFGSAIASATGPLIKNGIDYSTSTSTWMYHSIKHKGIVRDIDTSLIKFSQSSVNGADKLTQSMQQHGWQQTKSPIDIIKMENGRLITLDNTRVLAAHNSGIKAKGIIRDANAPLPKEFVTRERFATKKDGNPKTWGEAVKFRINNQNKEFRELYSDGSNITGTSHKP